MATESQQLARVVAAETGLVWDVEDGVDSRGDPWRLLRPAGAPINHAFAIRVTTRWRRVVIAFESGQFAGDLLAAMGDADAEGRAAFRAVLAECRERGGDVKFRVNDTACDPEREEHWPSHWSRVSLSLNIRTDTEVRDGDQGLGDAQQWSRLFVAAVVALLPVQPDDTDEQEGSVVGFAEGGQTTLQSTRYERDRRNRAAAIAIWGCRCQACGVDFGHRYGDVASGFIHVHHTTRVSDLAPGTVVDPARDLVPLCPNCHGVAHLRNPPFSVEELRDLYDSGDRTDSQRRHETQYLRRRREND